MVDGINCNEPLRLGKGRQEGIFHIHKDGIMPSRVKEGKTGGDESIDRKEGKRNDPSSNRFVSSWEANLSV